MDNEDADAAEPDAAGASPAGDVPGRPLGWWVKQADRQLDALFTQALDGTGADRRAWQVLSSLTRPAPLPDLEDALAVFEPPDAVRAKLAELIRLGWLQEQEGLLHLTPEGQRLHAVLAPLVAGVRGRVSAALEPQEYARLVELLQQLVDELGRT